MQIVLYHPQSNGMVERSHQDIVDALAKVTGEIGRPRNWVWHLAGGMWADRITVRRSAGVSPYRLAFGPECLLPVDLAEETWGVLDWQAVDTSEKGRAELLALRARQLERREEDLKTAAANQKKSREANKAYFDAHHHRRPDRPHTAIASGDYVILHDTRLEQSHSHKLADRWNGPYKVIGVSKKSNRGTYKLAELDGTPLGGYHTGDRIKKFVLQRE